MLLPDDVFRMVLLGLLLGYTAMAALSSFEVWRRRSLVVQGRDPRPLSGMERLALLSGGGGVLAMVAAIPFRLALPREGVLVDEGVETVRVPPGYEVVDVASGDDIAVGAVLARFRVHRPDGQPTPDIVEFRAPAAGTVAYRFPSPASAYGPNPLLVVSPPDGFRVRLRLPTREVEDLRSAGTVDLDLLGEEFLERRFSGHLVSARPMVGEPSWSIVEVAGQPHPEAVRDTVAPPPPKEGEDMAINVALKWSPPVLHLPLFQTGLALEVVALLLSALAAVARFSGAAVRSRAAEQSR